ncbi:AGAMOUS-like 26 isoform 1 [Hibiscus syriacus]|uniref:AGAMOUS-like 26 isoform 1 n=1 Tax=Hibiscus syriacus TaxID=106335 RepID=A0A6A3BNG5_HIBSY|nr:AGAMOUS-like 26 isoform 1 [Hibiscus syriacus]
MKFLFVRIVRARDLPLETPTGIMNPYVEIKTGNYRATTKYFQKKPDSEWNQVFAFTVDRLQVPWPHKKLEDINGVNVRKGELMLAIWYSIQADRVFSEAWHSDSAIVSGKSLLSTRSKAYLLPKLWYLRVNVIQAQDLVPGHKGRNPEVYVKSVGDVILRTRVSPDKNVNPKWNEDLVFVVSEPFVDPLIIMVEDRLENNTIRHLGTCVIHLSDVDQRLLPLLAKSKWYNLEDVVFEDGRLPAYSKIAVDDYDRNFGVGDHECYWFASNEGVFDDCHLHDGDVAGDGKDPSIGKPNGVKRAGEIQLAIRFTCTSYFNLFLVYTMNPLLPPMHHIYPFSLYQLNSLREQATQILCSSLSRTKPLLRSEVVEYMLDGGSTTWSLRKAKANFFRILATFKCLSDARKWFDEICKWKNPTATVAWWERPMHPTHIDAKQFVPATADELDEEFDTFPSSRRPDVLRMERPA